jgi:hypothetical protein
MHRVELKELIADRLKIKEEVPNAPCGVESHPRWSLLQGWLAVPNAPCGVERQI